MSDLNTAHLIAIRQMLMWLLLIIGAAAVLYAKDILFPIVFGILVALTLSPVVRFMGRFGLPAGAAAALVMLSVVATLGFSAYSFSDTVATWVSNAPSMGYELKWKLRGLLSTIETVQEASEQVDEIAKAGADGEETVAVQQPNYIQTVAGHTATFGSSILVGLILAFLLLASGDMIYRKIIQSFDRFADKKRALTVAYDIERRISNYLLSITIINAGLGICVGLWLFFIDMPNPIAWGVAAFLLNYLPYLGGITGVALCGLYAIVTFDTLGAALIAPLGYFTLTSLEGQFVTPYFLGRRLALNTVSVFLAVLVWGWLWGIPGMLMAVPFLVFLKVICDNVEGMARFGNFLAGEQSHPV